MGEPMKKTSCQIACWALGAGAGLVAFVILMALGDWSFIQAVFGAAVVFIVLGGLLSWILCKPLPALGEIKAGMDELWTQTKAIYGLGDARPKHFPKQIAFNLIPMIGAFRDDGYTEEEAKMWAETHKILDPDIQLTVSVNLEFDRPISPDEAREILREAPGVLVVDKAEADGYVTPIDAAGEFAVFVSRIRKDPTVENGLNLWVVSDNLRKGAALNAVQIAEVLVQQRG